MVRRPGLPGHRLRGGRLGGPREGHDASFEDIDDGGMWVSRSAVVPLGVDGIGDLPAEMTREGVEFRSLPRLTPLKPVWRTTLHASGIRTRNALDWGPPGWSHSKPGRQVIA